MLVTEFFGNGRSSIVVPKGHSFSGRNLLEPGLKRIRE